ncbi:hypothetical protein [Rhizobium sp. FKL33]|uniref:hypothetical protein n=1 Tax=Rhizobium sp. FKL33 TaxID=2562307 RepID=UPI0010C0C832|nr:hypothetical protein [Rhizobium sp. FKL33]
MRFILLILMAVGLSSCINNDEDLSRARAHANKHPENIAGWTRYCENQVRYWNVQTKTDIAIYVRTTKDKLPTILCRRIAKALTTNSVTLADIKALTRDGHVTPRMIAALRNG